MNNKLKLYIVVYYIMYFIYFVRIYIILTQWLPDLSRGWSGPGRGVDHQPHIWRRGWRKSRAIPLLYLWAFVASLPVPLYIILTNSASVNISDMEIKCYTVAFHKLRPQFLKFQNCKNWGLSSGKAVAYPVVCLISI